MNSGVQNSESVTGLQRGVECPGPHVASPVLQGMPAYPGFVQMERLYQILGHGGNQEHILPGWCRSEHPIVNVQDGDGYR